MNAHRLVILVVLAGVGVGVVVNALVPPRDSTDGDSERSGMVIHRDALTGCEYLRAGGLARGAALTPRLGADGKPRCGVREEQQR